MKLLRIGTRDSVLAMAQANIVANAIRRYDPDVDIEIVPMKTTGDKLLDKPVEQLGGKGVFVKELDAALLYGNVDICVHSLKDLPMEETPGLCLVAVSEREDPRDALILPENADGLPQKLIVGSSSLRRRIQLEQLYPGCIVKPMRGNVLTRLKKLDEGDCGALILAAAGLRRLGLENHIYKHFSVEEMIPACGQGILAVTARKGEGIDKFGLSLFHSADSWDVASCERAFLRILGGGCTSPVTAYAQVADDRLTITGYAVDNQGRMIRGTRRGARNDAVSLGEGLALQLIAEMEKNG